MKLVNLMDNNFSVLMAVCFSDNPQYLNDAIISIFDNQSIKPKQIVIVVDGFINNDLQFVLDSWKSNLKDILIITYLQTNQGLAFALNFGLQLCNYDLVARMDSDDISLSERFEKQIDFMNRNPHISVLSSRIEEFDITMNKSLGFRNVPISHTDFKDFIVRRNPINHPASFFRKKDVISVGGYPLFKKAQDYALWSLMFVKGFSFANIDQTLLNMRTGNGLLKRRGFFYFKNEIKILHFQLNIGLISNRQFLTNFLIRGFIRIQPNFLKAFIYKVIKRYN